MLRYQEFLSHQFGPNTVRSYFVALAVFLVLLIVFKIFRSIIISKLDTLAKKTKSDFDDRIVALIESIPGSLYTLIALYVALNFLILTEAVEKVIDAVFIIIVVFYVIKVATRLFEHIMELYFAKSGEKEENMHAMKGLSLLIRIALWAIGILLILSNLGLNVSTLIASMGIGGIAIALAAQNILADLFSSFSIYFDKPFQIGDFIVVGTEKGTVEKIGLKTTRLKTLQGEELVISNRDLTNAHVHNFKKLKKRRVTFTIGVTYETTLTKLKKIPKIIKDIIRKEKLTNLDRVHFMEYGDFSLIYEIVAYFNTNDYTEYMDARQNINFAIKKEFEKEKIEMAFPTQTIYVHK